MFIGSLFTPSRQGIIYIDNSTAVLVTIIFDFVRNKQKDTYSILINEGGKVLEEWDNFVCVDKGHYTNNMISFGVNAVI